MKYTVDTEAKTIQLHDQLTITQLVGLLTDIKGGMDYKIIGVSPEIPYIPYYPLPRYTPPYTVTCESPGTLLGNSILESEQLSNGINIKRFEFPGGFAIKMTSVEEEE
jgi:hypothetical protein